ncbi:MAG: tRNA epoxyqueuosine(34) reductase QueG, partial [Prevotella sp.]|nr:tRNA epoxyqueuosine(34) reductase QueG [Prevotella sp.]
RCLSYQTIEHRGPLDADISDLLGNSIYGCDRCQQSCPWNRFATPTDIPELQPSEALLAMTRDDWHHLTPDQYRALFKGSAVKRTKYEGLMRNIKSTDPRA